VPEPVGLVARLDAVAVVGEPVEQRGGHLGVAEDGGLFPECQLGGDHQCTSDQVILTPARAGVQAADYQRTAADRATVQANRASFSITPWSTREDSKSQLARSRCTG